MNRPNFKGKSQAIGKSFCKKVHFVRLTRGVDFRSFISIHLVDFGSDPVIP